MEHLGGAEFILMGIVFFSYTAQAISGFGSTVIAVTLGVHLFPLPVLIPALVLLDLLLNGFLSVKYIRQIQTKLLFVQIIPFMAAGALAGLFLFDLMAGDELKTLLGVLVMILSGAEILAFSRQKMKPLPPAWQKVLFFLGGIIHGLYASGGPVVVYATSRIRLPKTHFRAVLTALWSIISAIMLLFFLAQGQLTPAVGELSLFLLPAIIAGLVAGEILHHKINEGQFRLFIYILLFFAGAALL